MAHIRGIVDEIGDTVDQLYFCSDFCNQAIGDGSAFEVGGTIEPYDGWNGCHEVSEGSDEYTTGSVDEEGNQEVLGGCFNCSSPLNATIIQIGFGVGG